MTGDVFRDFAGRGKRGDGDCENHVWLASGDIGDTQWMASDGNCGGKLEFAGFALALSAPTEAAAERLFTALADGGEAVMPLEETFGLKVSLRHGDEVFQTYFTEGHDVEHLGSNFSYFDLTPYGRQEDWEDSPEGWPQTPPIGLPDFRWRPIGNWEKSGVASAFA